MRAERRLIKSLGQNRTSAADRSDVYGDYAWRTACRLAGAEERMAAVRNGLC